jgi:hypothetical protein
LISAAFSVHGSEPVGAHRARALALRPEHPEIRNQRVMRTKQVDQAELTAVRIFEPVVLGNHRPGRQRAALFGKPRHAPAKLDFFSE